MPENMGRDPEAARASLRDAEASGSAAAARVANPRWFEFASLAIIAVLVLAMALPLPFTILLISGCLLALYGIVSVYRKRYGVWVSGYRPGRTQTIALTLAAILALIQIGVWVAHHYLGLVWAAPAGAAAAVLAGFVFGRLWMSAYRVETGAETGAHP